jgi:hypothetical protein
MLTYYSSSYNVWTFRVQPTGSANLTMHLQNMTTLVNTSASISNYTYDPYESKLAFTGSQIPTLVSASVGEQYRCYISDATCSIWHGSISVFTSQSVNKPTYVNQIPLQDVYVSNVTDNEYIILE